MEVGHVISDRPQAPPVRPGGIAPRLKELCRWVAWRYEARDNKWTKVPKNPHTGSGADSTRPATWGTFQQALDYYHRQRGIDGIGFMLGDGFAGLDLDNCLYRFIKTDAGEQSYLMKRWAWDLLQCVASQSYAEISPSGGGVKIIGVLNQPLPGPRCKQKPFHDGAVEIYRKERFFTVTGDWIEGTQTDVGDFHDGLSQVYLRVFPALTKSKRSVDPATIDFSGSDAEVLADLRRSKKCGAEFARLWTGQTVDCGGDESQADYRLLSMLAWRVGPDVERINQLFRSSGLMRAKWDSPRGSTTYGKFTIANVLARKQSYWMPRRRKAATCR